MARDRPSPYGEGSRSADKKPSGYRSAGPVPRERPVGEPSRSRFPANNRWRAGESDLTPVGQERLILTRSGAGAPELQSYETPPDTVARGPVPRDASLLVYVLLMRIPLQMRWNRRIVVPLLPIFYFLCY